MLKRTFSLSIYFLIAFILLLIAAQRTPSLAHAITPVPESAPVLKWDSVASSSVGANELTEPPPEPNHTLSWGNNPAARPNYLPNAIQTPLTDTESLPENQDLVWSERIQITHTAKRSREYFDVNTLIEFEGRLYVGMEDGGVFVSEDEGETWQFAGHGLPDDRSVQTLVALEGLLYAQSGAGVFASENGGESWQLVSEELPTPVQSLQAMNGRLYARTRDGLFVSQDGCESWQLPNEGLPNVPVQVVVASDGRLYATTETEDGLFVSEDGGTSWSLSVNGLPIMPIQSLLADKERLYARIEDRWFVSQDGGNSWGGAYSLLEYFPSNFFSIQAMDGLLYGGTLLGVEVSRDGGASWQSISSQALSNERVRSLEAAEGRLYAGTDSGIFVSEDKGANWRFVGEVRPDTPVAHLLVVEGRLYAGTESGLFVSQDGGANWQPAGEDLLNGSIWLLSAIEKRVYAKTEGGMFVSQDGGATWQAVKEGLPPKPVHSLLAQDGRLYAGTSNGIFVSEDGGGTWQPTNAGLPTMPLNSLLVAEERVYVGTLDGLFVSEDRGANWQTTSQRLDNLSVNLLLANDGRLYVQTIDDHLLVSKDEGHSWQSIDQGLPSVKSLMAIQGRLYAITEQGTFVSEESGQNWQPLHQALTGGGPVRSLLVAKDHFYAGTANGLFVSKDRGSTWQPVSDGLTTGVYSLLEADGLLYAGTESHGVWISKNGGTTWQPASDDLTTDSIISLLEADGRLYAGTLKDGVWMSEDKGDSWSPAGKKGLTNPYIQSLLIFKGPLYAGTLGGLFVSQDGGTSWRLTNDEFRTFAVYSLLETEGRLYIGMLDGVAISLDGGKNWQVTGQDVIDDDSVVTSLLWFEERLYAGTHRGELFVSLDKGQNWQRASEGLSGDSVRSLLATTDGQLYAGTERGLSTSADDGMSWQASSGSVFRHEWEETDHIDILTLSFDPDNSNTLLAGTNRGVYRSVDRGQSWNNRIPTAPFEVYTLIDKAQSDQQVSYAVEGTGLFRSEDGGASWSKFGEGLPVGSVYSLAIHPDGTTLYAGTDRGVYKSKDGGVNWTPSGSLTSTVSNLLLDMNDAQIVYAGADRTLYQSTNRGDIWESVAEVPAIYDLAQAGDGAVYVATENGLYRYSPSSGQSERLLGGDIRSIALDPDHSNFLYLGTSTGVLLSTDGGQSWRDAGLSGVVSKLYVVPGTRNLYAVTKRGIVRTTLLQPSPVWPWVFGFSGLAVIIMVQVGLGYRDYRFRWQNGTPLQRLVVLLAASGQVWEARQFEQVLVGWLVPTSSSQLESELQSAVREGLLLRRGAGYGVASPLLARALLAHEGQAGQKALAEQVRRDHPLCESARRFLQRAGLTLEVVEESLIYRSQATSASLKGLLPEVVYSYFLPNQELDGDQVRAIQQRIKELDEAAGRVFVITDQRVTDDGWAQIGTLRMKQFTTLPIESALINEGLATGEEWRLLYDELEMRLGLHYDPYDVRDPVAGAFSFFGRDVLVETILRRISQGRPVAIFGFRKLGKSSLLQALRDRAEFPVAVVNLQTIGRGKSLVELYRRILKYWAQWARVRYELAWQPAEIPADTPTDAFVATTLDLLDEMEQIEQGARLGLFLDEVERIVPRADGSGPDLTRYLTLLGALRGLVDEDGRLSLVVASLNPSINRINAWQGEQNPTFNLFQELNLPPLAEQDCMQMVRNIGKQIGLVYSDEAVQQIYHLSGGHPFLARQLCSLLYQLRGRQGGQIESSELPKGIHKFIRDNQTVAHLDAGIWQDVGSATLWGEHHAQVNQQLLLDLAHAAEPVHVDDLVAFLWIREELPLQHPDADAQVASLWVRKELPLDHPDVDARQSALINLERYHIIHQPQPDCYAIRFCLLRTWLRRRKLGLV